MRMTTCVPIGVGDLLLGHRWAIAAGLQTQGRRENRNSRNMCVDCDVDHLADVWTCSSIAENR